MAMDPAAPNRHYVAEAVNSNADAWCAANSPVAELEAEIERLREGLRQISMSAENHSEDGVYDPNALTHALNVIQLARMASAVRRGLPPNGRERG